LRTESPEASDTGGDSHVPLCLLRHSYVPSHIAICSEKEMKRIGAFRRKQGRRRRSLFPIPEGIHLQPTAVRTHTHTRMNIRFWINL